MDAESNRKIARLATISLILGILSFGLFLFACLILIWIKLSPFDEFRALALLGQAAILFLGSLILGIPGFVIAFISLARIRKEGGDDKTLRTVIIGLVLGSVGPTIVLIFLAYIFLFNSSVPPPVLITPSPLVPLPTGG